MSCIHKHKHISERWTCGRAFAHAHTPSCILCHRDFFAHVSERCVWKSCCSQAGVFLLQTIAFVVVFIIVNVLSFFRIFCLFIFFLRWCESKTKYMPECVCLSNVIFDYINLLKLRAQTHTHTMWIVWCNSIANDFFICFGLTQNQNKRSAHVSRWTNRVASNCVTRRWDYSVKPYKIHGNKHRRWWRQWRYLNVMYKSLCLFLFGINNGNWIVVVVVVIVIYILRIMFAQNNCTHILDVPCLGTSNGANNYTIAGPSQFSHHTTTPPIH